MVDIWSKYSLLLLKLGFKKPDFIIEGLDDCCTGPRYKHVVCTIIYKFTPPNIIQVSWSSEDILLLLHILYWEFNHASSVVHEDYKPIFIYDGNEYCDLSEDLIQRLVVGKFVGTLRLNIPECDARSQILLFKQPLSSKFDAWLDTYHSTMNDFVK
jgi:hypothetical protein